MKMKEKQSESGFEELQQQTNSDQAKEIEREWKKKVQAEKDKCYTKLMIIAVAVMVIIFIILISFLRQGKKQHVQLDQVQYKNTNYNYMQSNLPHLKFLYPKDQNSLQVRLLKALGIIYPEVIPWIEANVQQNMKVLFIPNENSGVNVLGMTLGYYLKSKMGGSLDIGVTKVKYQQMTTKNAELMDKERQQGKMAINFINLNEQIIEPSLYNLIVIENNNYAKYIKNAENAKIIIIKRQTQNSLLNQEDFPQHRSYEIIKGKSNDQLRQLFIMKDLKYGYALIPYSPSKTDSSRSLLLVPKNITNIEECQQKNVELSNNNTSYRNLVVYLQNQTFASTTIYYGLENTLALQLISKIPTISRLYSNTKDELPNVIQIQNKEIKNVQENKDIMLGQQNYYILGFNAEITYDIKKKDIFFIMVENDQQVNKLQAKYPQHQITLLSPYNNKGCFYPPPTSQYRQFHPQGPFFVIVSPKK